jgi:hypothetical protein
MSLPLRVFCRGAGQVTIRASALPRVKPPVLHGFHLASVLLIRCGMKNSKTREGMQMDAAWRQILVASVVIVTLFALGALEVMTARLPVDRSVAARVSAGPEPGGPFQDFLLDTTMTEAPSK